MTLPALINKTQDNINRNRLKREYSLFQQAFQQISAENDFAFKNALSQCQNTGKTQHACLKNLFKQKLKTAADCDKNNGTNLGKCFVQHKDVRFLNGNPANSGKGGGYFNSNTTSGLVLDDGSSVSLWLDSTECTAFKENNIQRCAFLVIDVNGPKLKPNTWGKDLFLFFIYADKIVPADKSNTDACLGDGDECDGYSDDCEAGKNYGLTCASKYLFE